MKNVKRLLTVSLFAMLMCIALLFAFSIYNGFNLNAGPMSEEKGGLGFNGKTGFIDMGDKWNIDLTYVPDGQNLKSGTVQQVYEYEFTNGASNNQLLITLISESVLSNMSIGFAYSNTRLEDTTSIITKSEYEEQILDVGETMYIYLVATVTDSSEIATYSDNVEWVVGRPITITYQLGDGTTKSFNHVAGREISKCHALNLWHKEIQGVYYNSDYSNVVDYANSAPSPTENSTYYVSVLDVYPEGNLPSSDWFGYASASKTYYVKKGTGTLPTNVIIPKTYDNGTNGEAVVTSISSNAFQNQTSITSVIMPDTIQMIGNYAFGSCSKLTSIEFPESLESLYAYAFTRTGLTSVHLPKNVELVGTGTFSNCSSLQTITVDIENESYDSRNNCNAIIKSDPNLLISGSIQAFIPNTVTGLNNYSFSGIPITVIDFPASVETIGQGAFVSTSLTSVVIPTTVNTVGANAFYSASKLTAITVGAKEIGSLAFGVCKVAAATFLEGVESIGENCFEGCPLGPLVIPSTVKSVAGSLRTGSGTQLTSIKVAEGNTVYTSRDPFGVECNVILKIDSGELVMGCCNSTIPAGTKTILKNALKGKYTLKKVNIPRSVSLIEDEAFNNCYGVTQCTVEVGNTIYTSRDANGNECGAIMRMDTKVLEYAFANAKVPEGIEVIKYRAFYNISVTNAALILPSTLTTIEDNAFEGSNISSGISISSSVTRIGKNALCVRNSSISIAFQDTTTWYVTTSSEYSGGDALEASALTDTAANNTLFKTTYKEYYWYKV